jgi:Transposase, Mutator family
VPRLAEPGHGISLPVDAVAYAGNPGPVMDGMAEWQSRPLDPVYAVVFVDAVQVKIREGQVANRPVCVALGVTVDGERDILGLWAGEHGDGEGAKSRLRVLTVIKNRGTRSSSRSCASITRSARSSVPPTRVGQREAAAGGEGPRPLPISGG